MNAEHEILDNLVKHAAKLALTPDPEKRIAASYWEIFFRSRLEAAASGQSESLAVCGVTVGVYLLNDSATDAILDDLVKHASKLALTTDPEKRIIASRWEIFFRRQLTKVDQPAALQLSLVSLIEDDFEESCKVAEEEE